MKILVLGTGVANDGVVMLLKEEGLDYDYLKIYVVMTFYYKFVFNRAK